MEKLMIYLIDKKYLAGVENYLNFMTKAETYLAKGEE